MSCLPDPGIASYPPLFPESNWGHSWVLIFLFSSFRPPFPECFERDIFKVTRQLWGQNLSIQDNSSGTWCSWHSIIQSFAQARALVSGMYFQPYQRCSRKTGSDAQNCTLCAAARRQWRWAQRRCHLSSALSLSASLFFVSFSQHSLKLTEKLHEHREPPCILHQTKAFSHICFIGSLCTYLCML